LFAVPVKLEAPLEAPPPPCIICDVCGAEEEFAEDEFPCAFVLFAFGPLLLLAPAEKLPALACLDWALELAALEEFA
jgi:hypothetical protein